MLMQSQFTDKKETLTGIVQFLASRFALVDGNRADCLSYSHLIDNEDIRVWLVSLKPLFGTPVAVDVSRPPC